MIAFRRFAASIITAAALWPIAGQAQVPAICNAPLSADNIPGVAAFIWAGCQNLLNWPHDKTPRMTGPQPNGTDSVHGFVLNYYAPSVYAWLKAGRPAGGIPDGALIIKQMYQDAGGMPGAVSGWTIIVKQASASYDGWFWGYVDPQKSMGGDGLYGGMFYDPNCVACHGSASTRELTYSSLDNIATQFGGTAMPARNGLSAGSTHGKVIAPALRSPILPPIFPYHVPNQANSVVLVGPKGPTGFVTSDVCSGCHDASNLAFKEQAHMTWPQNIPPAKFATTTIANISPFGEWGASLMGLAGRDPVFQAQRESETVLYPEVKNEIDNECYTCHGVMGKRQLETDKPGTLFTHAHFLASDQYGGLARDGVSCLACHRMTPEGLGKPESFTGNFKITDAKTVFGPFQKVVEFPMRNAVGMTPKHGAAITDPAMCGSCHVVETPILDARKKYNGQSFNRQKKSHEQTTYLEWLNSSYQTMSPPTPNGKPRTCQECHMPRSMNPQADGPGAPLIKSRIANIQDNTFVDASNKPFPNTAPAAEITLAQHEPYGRHTFVGANVFVQEMFRQFDVQLGLTQGDRNYDTGTFPKIIPRLDFALQQTTEQVQQRTATVNIRAQRRSKAGLEVDVAVTNLSGHKLPSGVGFRRAFVEFAALDATGTVLWASGRSDAQGVLVDANGKPLPTEFSKTQWQPHFRTISSPSQVQIYESRTKDPAGLLTTSFLALATPVKDNRLMPQGWRVNGPYASWTAPVGVTAQSGPGYFNGSGSDLVTYRVPAAVAGKVASVRATLYYQSIPPYYLKDRFDVGGNGPNTQILKGLVQKVNYQGTAAEGWKLRVAAASAAARR